MATTYKTPGVYINEVSTLPASIAEVETAIPAFIGYTEFANNVDGSDLTEIPKRIKSMVEFQQFFGGAADPISSSSAEPEIKLNETDGFKVESVDIAMKYYLYHSMALYFANGGGPCYIVSVGGYSYARTDGTISTDIAGGVDAIELEDEPTLLVCPDAVVLSDVALGVIQKQMLTQCNKLQDRFTVMDLVEDVSTDDIGESGFRDEVGTQYLKYGAAYGPWLETTLKYDVQYSDLDILNSGGGPTTAPFNASAVADINAAVADLALIQAQFDADYLTTFDGVTPLTRLGLKARADELNDLGVGMRALLLSVTNADILAKVVEKTTNGNELYTIIRQAVRYDIAFPTGTDVGTFANPSYQDVAVLAPYVPADFNYGVHGTLADDASAYGGETTAGPAVTSAIPAFRKLLVEALGLLDEIKTEAERVIALLESTLVTVDPIYAGIKRAIAEQGIIIPSSGAVVGVYAAVDADRGVWKAPANVSLSNVVKPTIKIDSKTQESLNVHSTGKSVNIIRSFTGKGVLIWGARTLAGNDNEWRYVPVRRLFNTIEESIKKATEFVVFEPNDANTWLRTRTMIENYLAGLWRQGALAGAKPEDAFFVNVGLGTTMIAQDILEGRMIVEIGVAAVRPAEFIIIKFSHKLQES